MRNVKLTIEYDGTGYNGWQIQNEKRKAKSAKLKTIQQEIEKAIKRITGRHSTLYASGRTDSGVHAKGQVANFHTKSTLTPEKLQKALNAVLPKDISIAKIEEVATAFHSRFCAKSKTYRYTILNRKSPSPFLNRYSLHIPYKLNFSLMRDEVKILLGRHNFKSFQAADIAERSPLRTIKKINVNKTKDGIITIDIEADGFLYNMARNIVGTLIDIARGKLPAKSMEKILNAKDRKAAGPTAPAKGLCLLTVKY